MKTHIINILPHEPDYRFLQDKPRPAINWDTPDGNWVGIFRNEIPDKLGREVLRHTDEFEYEVWQTDYRADQMYSHRFEDGLVHRLFPAYDEDIWHGMKMVKDIRSPALIKYLLSYSKDRQVVINLNGNLIHLSLQVIRQCGHLPILQTFRGTILLPETLMFRPRINLLAAYSYYRQHQQVKELMPQVDYVTYMNKLHLDHLEHVYDGPRSRITSGCNFDFWKDDDKQACRKRLNLPQDKIIFFTSSLLKPIKQLDKLIKKFRELDADHDFMLLISGHGTKEYEKQLRELGGPLIKKDKLRFVGFIVDEELRDHYNASDLFISCALSEGGPTSSIKAIACRTDVFTTKTGNVYEMMEEQDAGIRVEIRKHSNWKQALDAYLRGERTVPPFDYQTARELFHWQNIAACFSDIYREIARKYYSEKRRTA